MKVIRHEMSGNGAYREAVKEVSPGACRICNGVKDGFNIQSEAGCPSRQAPKVPLRG
jgi:hypothetical protein